MALTVVVAAVLHGHPGQPDVGRCRSPRAPTVTDVNGDGHTDLGDTITWSFLVQNTGTVSVTGLAVTDAKAGAGQLPGDGAGPGRLDDLHLRGVLDHPGRRGRRRRLQHGDRVRDDARRRPSVTSSPSSTDTPITQAPGLLAQQDRPP